VRRDGVTALRAARSPASGLLRPAKVANAMVRRRLAPKSKQSSRLRPPDAQASRSWPPLVCEPHDSFALRAVTAASAIAWPRLSDTGNVNDRSALQMTPGLHW
jgi:hypothetical protein